MRLKLVLIITFFFTSKVAVPRRRDYLVGRDVFELTSGSKNTTPEKFTLNKNCVEKDD